MSTDSARCEHCLTINLHQGTTHGNVETLGSYPCYVSRFIPTSENSTTGTSSSSTAASTVTTTVHTCIVLFTDIFGYELPNIRLLADKLALQSQLTVYVPDILLNDAVEVDKFDRTTFPQWRQKHGDNETLPVVKDILRHLRDDHKYTKIGGWGFCFGGRYAALAAANTFTTNSSSTTSNPTVESSSSSSTIPATDTFPRQGLDAYVVAHPSFVTIDDFNHLTVPGLYLCAETDMQFPLDVAKQVEEVLVRTHKIPHVSFKYYNGTTHGFTLRGNEQDPVVVAARDDALLTAANFFRNVLA